MSTVADVIAAIDAEGSTSWQIADEVAALDEVDAATGKPLTLKMVADRIWTERGVEWSPAVLGQYRSTARAFPIEARASMPTQTFRVACELRAHPDKLLAWKPAKDGDVLTVERARNLRGSSSARKIKPDAWRAKVDRALGTIATVAEHDPAAVVAMLREAVVALERMYPKAKRRDLRAV